MFEGHPEWSILAVEAPIESATEAFTTFRKVRRWTRDVSIKRFGKESGPMIEEIPVVQLNGSPWTIFIRSIFLITAEELESVPEEAQALSKKLKTRAVTFTGEDTSGAMGYDLYKDGARIERAEWDGGGNVLVFESQIREQPSWPNDDFKIADVVFNELGLYIPLCFAASDGKKSWVEADKKIWKEIKRADLINM